VLPPHHPPQINYGGTVPKSYYVRESLKVTYDTSVSISRGSVFDLEYDITAPSSVLRYTVLPPLALTRSY